MREAKSSCSNALGTVGGARAKPWTLAPSSTSHVASQEPLNPVCPDSHTFFRSNWPPNICRLPNLPRRAAFRPEAVEKGKLLESVHRLPKTFVFVGPHLAVRRYFSQRLLFQHDCRVRFQI